MVEITDEEMKKVKDEYDKIKTTLAIVAPFLSSILRKVEILITKDKRMPTAGVDKSRNMAINIKFWEGLSFPDKAWVLTHEAMHIAFGDTTRVANRNMKAWNIVSDGVNNEIQKGFIKLPSQEQKWVFLNQIWDIISHRAQGKTSVQSWDDFLKLSKEEIYKMLPTSSKGKGGLACPVCKSPNVKVKELNFKTDTVTFKCKDCGHEWTAPLTNDPSAQQLPSNIEVDSVIGLPDVMGDLLPDKDVSKSGSSRELQEGDKESYNGTEEEKEKKWKDNITDALVSQKLAGKMPAGFQRLIDSFLEPEIPWEIITRQAIIHGLGKTIVGDWRRESRKSSLLPGIRRITTPQIIVMMDTSGSIDDQTLKLFLGVVYGAGKNNDVIFMPFDARTYELVKTKNQHEVLTKIAKNIRGGGGTEIGTSLKKTLEIMKPRDIVIVLTDGFIGDLEEKKVIENFDKIAYKAATSIFMSTEREWQHRGWTFIKVKAKKRRDW